MPYQVLTIKLALHFPSKKDYGQILEFVFP